jgi:tetratricopeptide (TPR) repeat protein
MMLDLANPHSVELILKPREGSRTEGAGTAIEDRVPSLFDVQLNDHGEADYESGVADLGIDDEHLRPGGGSAGRFLDQFLAGAVVSTADALAFGRLLRERLFAEANLRRWWDELLVRQSAAGRPLRVQALLPPGAGSRVSEIPLELLADDRGFFFRRGGNRLVRSVLRMRSTEVALTPGTRAALAWANPVTGDPPVSLDPTVFTRHEDDLRDLAAAVGLEAVTPPCREATRGSLARYLAEHRPIALLSIVAHGGPAGGSLLLHLEGHPDFPRDPGDPLRARDAAHLLRQAGVRVAFLWACHGGRHHAAFGAVAEALLDPEHGDVAVVVAAHAALRADATAQLFAAFLGALRGTAQGDFERALQEARAALPEDDLQWAAPVYYTRPLAPVVLASPRPEAPPLVPQAGQAARLEGAPALASYFRGRDKEVADGGTLLALRRLVTVLGAPGIGKTELAVAIAGAALASGRPPFGRALWISLQGMRSAQTLRGRLASAFGLERCESDEELARAVGNTPALLVLDNAEDLLDVEPAALRRLIDALLRLCPGVRCLSSSRRPLGPAAGHEEEEIRLQPLAPPDDLDAFVAAAGPRLMEEDRRSADLPRLVSLLEGHPLSLALVASQTGRGLGLADLALRIERGPTAEVAGFEVAGVEPAGDAAADLRRRNLAASLALSYEPLKRREPAAAEAFCWLGLLPAGLPAALVTAVFGEGGAEATGALLRSYLADKRGLDSRVALLAPIRRYARERLGSIKPERRRELAARTATALAAWLAGAHALLGTSQSRRAVDLAFQEQPSLEEILRFASEPGEAGPTTDQDAGWAEGLARAVSAWSDIVSRAGRPSLALALAERSATLLSSPTVPRAQARSRETLGDLYRRTARLAEAERAYLEALPLYQQIKDRLGEANTRKALGELYLRTARLAEAERAYLEALPLYQQIEERLGDANTRQAMGDLYHRTDRLAEAERAYLEALSLYQQIEERLGEANTRKELGDLYLRTDRLAKAERAYLEALPLYQQIEERLGEANTRLALGDLYLRTDRLTEAERAYFEALFLYQQIKDRLGEANTRKALGDLYRRTDRLAEAERAYLEALPLYQQIEERLGEANTLTGLGLLELAHARPAEGFRLLLNAHKIQREIEDRLGEAASYGYLARAALTAGLEDRAVVLADRARGLLREIEDRYGQRIALDDMVSALRRLNDPRGAIAALFLAWNLARDLGEPTASARAQTLTELLERFDPSRAPTPDELAAHEALLASAVELQENALEHRGEDPLSPLP